jgi:multidrug efflux pump subunit AcrA (membrane-fusion protein)
MNTKPNRRPIIVIIIILLVVAAAAGYWYFYMRPADLASGALTASGTVETTEISIAPEISGKILEVDVQEGDAVKAGDVLFKLDDTLLKAQRVAAAAGVDTAKGAAATADSAAATAQAQYDITYNAAQTQNKAPARTAGWTKDALAEFNLPDWYFSQTEQLTAAQAEVDVAQKALTDAQAKLVDVQGKVSSADFVKAEADLALAQARFAVADNLNTRVQNSKSIDDLTKRQLYLIMKNNINIARGRDPNWAVPINIDQELRDAAKTLYDDAKTALDDAQSAYDDALTTKGANDVLKARADVSIAQELYYTAQDYVRILQTGANSSSVTAAQKVLDQAQSAAAQAKIAINQAQANLDLVDAQIAKTTVTAPVDGVILTRAAEPGSVVNAGGVMLTLGRLDALTITVYVPEDRIGEVSLGQVAVDSFPGVTFNATVTFIADQAEFTPRNVQTVEGRKNTVFAVKLKLDNASGKLKPGMPADVTFSQK